MSGVCERTLTNLIDHLGSSLNDLEGTVLYRLAIKQGIADPMEDASLNHVRWSEYFLTSVINDAFRLLKLERPDLFVTRVRFKLRPGCTNQEMPDDCSKFAGDLQNTSDCTNNIVPNSMSTNQIGAAKKLAGLFCSGIKSNNAADYQVESYGFNPKSPNEFIVVPEVPGDAKAYVTISCVGHAPCFDWDDDADELVDLDEALLDIYEILVIEYALYRSYSADHESESSKEVAKLHWERCFTLINEGKRSDYFFHHPDLYLMGPIDEGTGNAVLRSQ